MWRSCTSRKQWLFQKKCKTNASYIPGIEETFMSNIVSLIASPFARAQRMSWKHILFPTKKMFLNFLRYTLLPRQSFFHLRTRKEFWENCFRVSVFSFTIAFNLKSPFGADDTEPGYEINSLTECRLNDLKIIHPVSLTTWKLCGHRGGFIRITEIFDSPINLKFFTDFISFSP